MAKRSWFSSFFSTVEAAKAPEPEPEPEEPELIDPQTELRERCAQRGDAQKLYEKYEQCNDRVNGKSKTTETCVEELFDYLHVVDHCVAHSLWSMLK